MGKGGGEKATGSLPSDSGNICAFNRALLETIKLMLYRNNKINRGLMELNERFLKFNFIVFLSSKTSFGDVAWGGLRAKFS